MNTARLFLVRLVGWLEAKSGSQFEEGVIAFYQVSAERKSCKRSAGRLAKLYVRAKPLIKICRSSDVRTS